MVRHEILGLVAAGEDQLVGPEPVIATRRKRNGAAIAAGGQVEIGIGGIGHGGRLAWAPGARKRLAFASASDENAPRQRGSGMALFPDYPIETARLRLRPFTRGDVEAVFSYRSLEEVALYLFDPPLSREECALAVQQRTTQVGLEEEGDRIILAVEEPGGPVVGEVSLILRAKEARQVELGWIFHPGHQGRGYASEAASALLDLAFTKADMHRAYARCDALNLASWRLMERLGMRREAHFREHALFKGRWDEEFIYAILCREWIGRQFPAVQSRESP